MNRVIGCVPCGQKLLSGDYEAATDNLKSWVSEIIWNQICFVLKLSEEERAIGLNLLTGHMFGKTPQKSGQLMGSIISFPILCIANFALCRRVCEVSDGVFNASSSGQEYMECDIPIYRYRGFINGDDCTLILGDFGRRLWSEVGLLMGLVESLGKTYFSDEFVEINSRLYAYDQFHGFRFTPLINMGLMYGLKRSEGVGDAKSSKKKADRETGLLGDERTLSIGARHEFLYSEMNSVKWNVGIDGDSWIRVWPRLNAMFLEKNKDLLNDATKLGIPWFVPKRLGGLGLHGKIKELDLQLCRAALRNGLKFGSTMQPAWKAWQVVSDRMRLEVGKYAVKLNSDESEREMSVLGRMVANVLFDSDVNFNDIFVSEGKAHHSVLKKNSTLWRQLTKGKYGFPAAEREYVDPEDGSKIVLRGEDYESYVRLGKLSTKGVPIGGALYD